MSSVSSKDPINSKLIQHQESTSNKQANYKVGCIIIGFMVGMLLYALHSTGHLNAPSPATIDLIKRVVVGFFSAVAIILVVIGLAVLCRGVNRVLD